MDCYMEEKDYTNLVDLLRKDTKVFIWFYGSGSNRKSALEK